MDTFCCGAAHMLLRKLAHYMNSSIINQLFLSLSLSLSCLDCPDCL
jgi:hypothetical protein